MSMGNLMAPNKVVITGMGVTSSLGCSVDDFWVGLLAGRSGLKAVKLEGLDTRTWILAQVTGYEPGQIFSRKELQRLSRSSQLALVAATEAIQDARLDLVTYDTQNIAVIIGSSIGGFAASEQFFQQSFTGETISPLTLPTVMNSAPASNVSIKFGLRGALINVDAACASSAHAVGYAFNLIRFGVIQMALAGGADSPFSPAVIGAWSSLRALSEKKDTPTEACRPFSRDRDGIVLAEGSGILVLETEKSAVERKAHIYAEVVGYGATADSHHLTQPALQGMSGAMASALSDAKVLPSQIDYINAHATATVLNDRIETQAIKQVFGLHAYTIPIVGIKGATGHSIAASGALELISCVLSIRDDVVPPTINVKVPDPDCDLDYVTEGKRATNVTYAMSNSFAFGGSNAVLVVRQYAP